MPPFKLRVQCIECTYRLTGWYPGILIKGDAHAADKLHAVWAFRLDGRKFCEIPSPSPPETW